MAYGTYQTRNLKAVHNPLRPLPLFRPASVVFGPSKTDRLVGELRNALYEAAGWERSYAEARAKLGAANRHNIAWRRKSQWDAIVNLNKALAAMQANLHMVAKLESELLALAVPSDRWAVAHPA